MANAILVARPGYNALTDTDPDHFALYADQAVDYILIKEKARGYATVGAGGSLNIGHGLSYVPFCLVFVESSAGVWRKVFSTAIDGTIWSFEVNETNLVLKGANGFFWYHIFYDNIT